LHPDLNILPVSSLKDPAETTNTLYFEVIRHTAHFHQRSKRFRWLDNIVNTGRNFQSCARIKYNRNMTVSEGITDRSHKQPCFIRHELDCSLGRFDQVNLER
jgi:hypothetical protein